MTAEYVNHDDLLDELDRVDALLQALREYRDTLSRQLAETNAALKDQRAYYDALRIVLNGGPLPQEGEQEAFPPPTDDFKTFGEV